MNPELPQSRPVVEATPQIPGSTEYFPDGTVRSLEHAPAHEQAPARVEQQSRGPVAPVPVVVPATPQPVVDPASQQSALLVSNAPATAADDDLMEKEWVDKVKSIIALTKGKPYEQAKAIALLQADYLKKRHNRTLGELDG